MIMWTLSGNFLKPNLIWFNLIKNLRPPLDSDLFTSDWNQLNLSLATNPVHILHDKHICIFSRDHFSKLGNYTIHNETKSGSELANSLFKILLCNASLGVGLTSVFSPSLAMWSSPDILIVGDNTINPNYKLNIGKTLIFNTSSFSKDSYRFKVYFTSNNEIEDSQIFMWADEQTLSG